MAYINNVFDNYYNISLEDRTELISRIHNLHETHKNEFNYNHSTILGTIYLTVSKMLKANNFEKFYSTLDKKEKKEFQTQLYLISKKVDKWLWYDVPELYERVSSLLDLDFSDVEKRENIETFIVDFDKVDEEFESCKNLFVTEGLSAERIVEAFCKRYYYFAFNKIETSELSEEECENILKKYSKPLTAEFNESMKKCNSFIHKSINESTRTQLDLLSPVKQMYTIFEALDLNKEKLNKMAIYREELREADKQISYDNKEKQKKLGKRCVKKRLPIVLPRN